MGAESKRAILAVILSGIILFGWQFLYGETAPLYGTTTTTETGAEPSKVDMPKNGQTTAGELADIKPKMTVEMTSFSSDRASYSVSSELSLVDATNQNTKLSQIENFEKLDINVLFNLGNGYKKSNFIFKETGDNKYSLNDSVTGISGTASLDKNGFLDIALNSTTPFKIKFNFITDKIEVNATMMNMFVLLGEDLETINVSSEEKETDTLRWFGVDFNYHLTAVIPSEPTYLLYKTTEDGVMSVFTSKTVNNFSYKQIFVKKSYDDLLALGNNLDLSVDFGILSLIAVPTLRGLQFFYKIFSNYGLAIIFLTIVMRMLTFPLQYKSFQSMKKMQVIQPELTALKDKYKGDPQRQQKETMALFKKAGANPIGGCLPMLLQMPIFFAFYKVLYSAVELVDAPFIFWITDLSQKDPFYVLPVLMGVSMFLNQKITPMTTTDPAQKKIMMFMPLIFSLFMINLPAGLTLYIFISTIMGMLQQLFVFKRSS